MAGADDPASGPDSPKRARRTRNPDRTRAAILAAATEEFAARGLNGASVNVIAAAAGVNKRMLYHYFESKDGLYLAVLEAVYGGLEAMLTGLELAARAPVDAVVAVSTALYDYVIAHPEFVRLGAIENMFGGRQAAASTVLPGLLTRVEASFQTIVARGVADGVFRAVDPFQLWLTIFAATSIQVSHRYTVAVTIGIDPATPQALETRRRHVVDVVLAALKP